MYELIMVILLGVAIVFAYFFACKIIATNSMNSPPLFFYYYLRKQKNHPILHFIYLTLVGLRDTESGFFARLNSMVSSSCHLEKASVGIALLSGKISQCLIVAALFLPAPYFLIFFTLLVGISWFKQRTISLRFVGILMGLLLMKFSIEMFLYLCGMSHDHVSAPIPGYLYLGFSQGHPWMFLFNGALVAALAWNIAFILPVILLISVMMKLTILQLCFMIMGMFLIFGVKYYVLSLTARGVIADTYKESVLFFGAAVIAFSLALLGAYGFFPEVLGLTMAHEYLLFISLIIVALVAITVAALAVWYDEGKAIINSCFPKKIDHGKGYKYSRTLFKETGLGTQILKNELRHYSLEQLAYSKKSRDWMRERLLDNAALDHIHTNFHNHYGELKTYLAVLQKSDDIIMFEEDAAACGRFLDDAHTLETNIYEKFIRLKMIDDSQKRDELSDLFVKSFEVEAIVFENYETVLKYLAKDDIDNLSKVIEEQEAVLQKVEGDYTSSHVSLMEGGHRAVALELIQLFQINLWLIGKQNEILKNWTLAQNKDLEFCPLPGV